MPAAGDNINISDFTFAVVKDSAPGTVSGGFTVATAVARSTFYGKNVCIKLDLVCTAGITATSANIADTTCYTMGASWRPTELVSTVFSANPGTGEVQLNTDGTVVLRTADANIAAAANVRMVFSFIRD